MKIKYCFALIFFVIFVTLTLQVSHADDVNISVEVVTPPVSPTPINDFTATPSSGVSPSSSAPSTDISPLELASPKIDTQAPTAPSNLRATKLGAITLTLAWDSSLDDVGVVGYQIYNAITGILVGTTNNTSFNFSGLTPNTTYKFYIRAYDSVPYYSSNSEVAEFKTAKSTTEEEKNIERQGGIAAFLIIGNLPKEASVGQPFGDKIKLTVADVGGNIVKGYAKAVHFTSSDTLAKLTYDESHPYTFVTQDVGVHEFAPTDFIFNTSGRQQLTISDNSVQSTVELTVNSTIATVLKQSAIYVEGFFNDPIQVSQANVAVASLIAGALLMPVLVNGFSGLNNLWPLILFWLTNLSQMLGLRRKRQTWGIVFNAQTGQPVPFALVKLLDQNNHLVELSISDNQGRYGLTSKHGTFTLAVTRTDFIFPSESKSSSFYERVYAGSEIKITDANQTVAFNIPLDPHAKSTAVLIFLVWLVKINRFIQKIRLPLFVLGAIFSLAMIILNFGFIYVAFLAYCVFMIIFDIVRLGRATAAGMVSDAYSHSISGAIVRIYHKQDNHLIDTDISNKNGRFKFKVQSGVYYLVATKPNYVDSKTHLMYLEKGQKKETVSSINIQLKKE